MINCLSCKIQFIPHYRNKQIEALLRNTHCKYKPVPRRLNIDAVCVVKEHRKIRSDHTFSYGNQFYLIKSQLRHSIAEQKIEIRCSNDNGFRAFFADGEVIAR